MVHGPNSLTFLAPRFKDIKASKDSAGCQKREVKNGFITAGNVQLYDIH